jgi:hypothetical protein
MCRCGCNADVDVHISGAANFWVRGGAPRVGADREAMGGWRERRWLASGPSVRTEDEKGRGHQRLGFGSSGQRRGGLALAVPRGGGREGVRAWVAHGQAATAAGPTTAGAGSCRRRGTGDGGERGAAVWLACGPAQR